MYNPNRLEWHPGDETVKMNPSVFCGGSCQATSEAFVAVSIVLLLLTPRALTHQRELRGFCFWSDRQGALADGLHGLNPRNTDNRTHPLDCRPALIERLVKDWVQRWNKARSISESIRQAHLVLRLFFNLTWSSNEAVKRWSGVESIHPWRTYA